MKKHLPESTLIIYGMAIAEAFTIAYGLIMLDGISEDWFVLVLILVRGLVIGGVGGLAVAVTANKIPRAGRKERPWAWGAFGVVLLSIVMIVSPVTYSAMSAEIIASVHDVVRIAISIAAGLLVPALTAAVAFTSGNLAAQSTSTPAQSTNPAPAPAPTTPAPAKSAIVQCALCGVPYAAVGGKGGHYKAHHPKGKP